MTDPKAPAAEQPAPVNPPAPEEVGDGRWRDRGTGLVVVPAPIGPLHLVFRSKYTALNPPIPGGERAAWSRWDVLDHVTLYGADDDVTAVVEALAYATPANLDLASIFDDIGPGEDSVADEWRELGHMARGQVARAWRVPRELTIIRLHPDAVGWFVDVGHAETIAVLRREVAAWSRDAALLHDPLEVDTSMLASGRRDVTTAVAGWLRAPGCSATAHSLPVFGSPPSTHNLICWAVWIPLLGETGQDRIPSAVGKFVTTDRPTPLLEGTPALVTASKLLGVRVH